LISCAATFACATAQDVHNDIFYRNNISVQPLYVFNQGVRIDYERQLHNPYHWLQVSTKGYFMNDKYDQGLMTLLFDDDRIEKLKGAGAELNYKYFFLKKRILYVSAGVSYSYFHTQQYDSYFTDFHEDGLTFYRSEYSMQTQEFNKMGFNTCFGVQSSPRKRFFVDGYVGFGYSHSFYDKNKYYPDTDNINGLSYSGPTFTTGLRIGIRF
jgi:hypothetical protein